MQNLLLALLLTVNASAYAQSQLIYANSFWQVIYSERKGYQPRCFITSQGHRIGAGYTYLVFFPNNIVQFMGDNIGDLLESATRVLLRAGDERVEIPVNTAVSGIMLVHNLMQGKTREIEVTVDGKSRTVHTFPTHGFQHAYMRMTDCLNEIEKGNEVVNKKDFGKSSTIGKSGVQVITIEAD